MKFDHFYHFNGAPTRAAPLEFELKYEMVILINIRITNNITHSYSRCIKFGTIMTQYVDNPFSKALLLEIFKEWSLLLSRYSSLKASLYMRSEGRDNVMSQ